jgi:hypothetical protein
MRITPGRPLATAALQPGAQGARETRRASHRAGRAGAMPVARVDWPLVRSSDGQLADL